MRHPSTGLRLSLFALLLLASTAGTAPATEVARLTTPGMTLQAGQDEPALSVAIDVTIRVHADNTAQRLETRRLRALGVAAVQSIGQQTIGYIEGMQRLDIVEAYTEKADGRKVPVDLATLITRDPATGLNAMYLRDLKVVTVIFPDLEAGDTVVLTTRIEHRRGIFAGHYFDQIAFPRNFPFADSTVRVIVPSGAPVNVAVLGSGIEHATTTEGNETRHVMTYRGRPPRNLEAGATSLLDRDPRIFVSTFRNYEDQAASYWEMARGGHEVTPEITRLADQITQGIKDRRAQAQAISHWVKRNIRYVAVYLGAARVVPNSAASVLRNRYGDCKDHVTLMAALLKAKGIASEHVLISAGNAYTLPEPATMTYLNHAIIYLPEFSTYDDPTVGTSLFGVLSTGTYDKPVLHVSDDGAYRARTPAMRAADHTASRRTRVTIAADGTVSGETVQTGTGIFASVARAVAGNISRTGAERAAEQQLRSIGTPGTGRFEIGTLSELGETYSVKANFVLNNRVRVAPATSLPVPSGLGILARPGAFLLGARHQNRTQPFQCFAGRQVEEVEVTFADGLPLPNLLRGRTIETAAFVYRSDYRLEGRTWVVRREFTSRVEGQVCAPEMEAAIADSMRAVNGSLSSRMAFRAPPKRPPVPKLDSTSPKSAANATRGEQGVPGLGPSPTAN